MALRSIHGPVQVLLMSNALVNYVHNYGFKVILGRLVDLFRDFQAAVASTQQLI